MDRSLAPPWTQIFAPTAEEVPLVHETIISIIIFIIYYYIYFFILIKF